MKSRNKIIVLAMGMTAALTGCMTSLDGRPVAEPATPATSPPRTSTVTISLAAPPSSWSICSMLTAEEVAWTVASSMPVDSRAQPAQQRASGSTTYECHYVTKGEYAPFAALTVLFAPNAGGLEAAGLEGATRNRANIRPVPGIGDGAATYTDPSSPNKRFITATKRLDKDSVVIFFNANSPIPDEVAPKLPDLARKVLAQLT